MLYKDRRRTEKTLSSFVFIFSVISCCRQLDNELKFDLNNSLKCICFS